MHNQGRDYAWNDRQNVQYGQSYQMNDYGMSGMVVYDIDVPPPSREEVRFRDHMWGQVETMDGIVPRDRSYQRQGNLGYQPRIPEPSPMPKQPERYIPEPQRTSSASNIPPQREISPRPCMFPHGGDSDDDIPEPQQHAYVPSRPISSRTNSGSVNPRPEAERSPVKEEKPYPPPVKEEKLYLPPVRKKEEPKVAKDPQVVKAEQFVNHFFPTRPKQEDLKRAPVIPDNVPEHVARLMAETGLDQEAFVPHAWEDTTEGLTSEICRYTITEYGPLGVAFSDFIVADPEDPFFYKADPWSGEMIPTEEEKYLKLIEKYGLNDCRETTRRIITEIDEREERGRCEYARQAGG